MKRFFAIGLAAGLAAVMLGGFAMSAADAQTDYIKERQERFKANGAAMKAIQAALGKGDFGMIEKRANGIAAWADEMVKYFPEDSIDDRSEAREEIWLDFERFTALAAANAVAARELAAVAASGDGESAVAALGKLGGTCKTCHQSFKE